MSLLLRGRHWLCVCATAGVACNTYGEPPSGAPAGEGATSTGGSADGGTAAGGKVSSGAASASGAAGSGSTAPATSGSGGGAGDADQGEAGAAACIEGDCCPEDEQKTEPGECGCGAPDADSDTDGTIDCQDGCPDDVSKTAPGGCGCGLPEEDTSELAACSSLKDALIHRYDFEGGGTMVLDRVGTAHGTVEGLAQQSEVAGKGVLALVGNAAYVNLPNFLISGLPSVTLEAWITWNGGKAWQRIFDIGESDVMPNPEDMPRSGKDYVFLTPMAGGSGSRLGFSLNGASVEKAAGVSMPLGTTQSHLVGVIDTVGDKMLYYLDGALAAEAPFTDALSDINDVNVWLGRSQYSSDPPFTGTYHDFRVYEQALSAQQVATSFAAGPDPAFLAP